MKDVKSILERKQKIIDKLEKTFEELPPDEANELKSELQSIAREEHDLKFEIALAGNTGAGKSSLLNALLDKRDFLPTSDRAGCTSVVIKLQKNERMNFEVDIEFMSKEEADMFINSLIDEEDEDDEDEDSEYRTVKESHTKLFEDIRTEFPISPATMSFTTGRRIESGY